MKKYYPGNVVDVKVIGIKPYGVFVSLDDVTTGLIHISEISEHFVSNIDKIVKIGEVVKAKILDINYEENKAKLSFKALNKRNRYKSKRCSLSEEKINVVQEFFPLQVRMSDFVKDAKERLMLND